MGGRSWLGRSDFQRPSGWWCFRPRSADALGIRPEDAVVLMTHSYEQDRELLAALLPLRPRYLGVLGARHRSSLLVSEVAAKLGQNGRRVL